MQRVLIWWADVEWGEGHDYELDVNEIWDDYQCETIVYHVGGGEEVHVNRNAVRMVHVVDIGLKAV